jgi:uncharacterized protein (DUF427 family)
MIQSKAVQSDPNDVFMPDPRLEFEPSPRWVRVKFGGQIIADSQAVILGREKGHLPLYYFPAQDVKGEFLVATEATTHSPTKGTAVQWTVRVGDQVAERAAWSYPDPLPAAQAIQDYVAFSWPQMEAWYEEEEEVFVHPRDPYKRIDVLLSSRHVQVVLGGEVVADSHRPYLLFETGLPTRYYLPPADVRQDYLEATSTHTRCPYKGLASYWSVRVRGHYFKDIVWGYLDPIPECPKIKGLLCFFNEKVEALYVDGELQPVPQTPWS